jgi:hypothetical protein
MSNIVTQAVTAAATTIYADVLSLPAGPNGIVKIDSELIIVGEATDTALINCTRGAGGTSAATHAVNAAITSYEAPMAEAQQALLPAGSAYPTVLQLTNPTSVPTAATLDQYSHIIVNFTSAGTNQSWTLPSSATNNVRNVIFTCEAASTGKTLSINSQSVGTGTAILFVWDGTAWAYIQ